MIKNVCVYCGSSPGNNARRAGSTAEVTTSTGAPGDTLSTKMI